MITMKDVQNFVNYINEAFGKKDVKLALTNNDFDVSNLKEENLNNMSDSELFTLYGNIVYIISNELGNGDFETMYDVLSDAMGLDEETVNCLLDW